MAFVPPSTRPGGHERGAAQVPPGGSAGGRCYPPVSQFWFARRVCCVPGAGTAGQAPVHMLLIWGRFRLGESFSWPRGGHGSRHVVPAVRVAAG